MLRLFRSLSRGSRAKEGRGRNKDDDWDAASPDSPERSRRRAVGRNLVDGDASPHSDYSPRHRPRADYFDRDIHAHNDDEEMADEEDAGDEDAVDTPLLPIFSAAHLDRLPLYNITHAIRLQIVQRCETTLSWEQLRSPQVSQFLVKPVQSQIRADHFNRATLCALLANCLQFQKEGQMNPGNVGVCRTRAMVAELLAMRLLKEFSTRELIDALSYDFDLLQGMVASANGVQAPAAIGSAQQMRRQQGRFARVSTIEIAIRAEAKRFLAHPLIVQHLEAIWSGNIVFHAEADNLHRKRRASEEMSRGRAAGYGYGTTIAHSPSELPAEDVLSRKKHSSKQTREAPDSSSARRTVTLYNPKEASLFKLSRLRVPRYRQIFSTLSFATMLALFILVLANRSDEITPLEVLFWFWSIGYMLDEVVGFSEQGFGLYILSFWNVFDLGILFLFVIYYVLRLYGIVLADSGNHQIAGVAYDVLASTAILLFPRLFNVLDHYRYFSQLLIAFRMMAQDLIAVLVLIIICCSGFFVALSLAFAEEGTDAGGVIYALFQLLMGFTPTVWDHWDNYNFLGKTIMCIFLTICHFLIVTILITVLTNSFMAIVKNAEEEHQFLFAVNTISMVKSDALFSYIPPSNIIGWVLSPLRYLTPLRQYVQFNRTIIKITHFPILFAIFTYERIMMGGSAYAPVEMYERHPHEHRQPAAFNKAPEPYPSAHRLREPSVISFRKDRALDEVFRRPFHGDTVRTTTREMEQDKRQATAVDQWMQAADNEGGASPPMEQPRSVISKLEHRRPKFKRANTSDRIRVMQSRDFSAETRSVGSDPDQIPTPASRRPNRIVEESEPESLPVDTEADGDDEINDESDVHGPAMGESAISLNRIAQADESETEYFATAARPNSPALQLSHAARARLQFSPDIVRGGGGRQPYPRAQPSRRHHERQVSSGTILFAPLPDYDSSSPNRGPGPRVVPSKNGTATTGTATATPNPLVPNSRSVYRKPQPHTKARPIIGARQKTAPAPILITSLDSRPRQRHASFNARALDLASEIGDNKFTSGIDAGGISGMPASFSEQMMRDRDFRVRAEEERRRGEDEEKGMVNRIMLARMHTLEEGFREVLKEIKDLSQGAATSSSRRESEVDSAAPPHHRSKPARPKVDPRDLPGPAPGPAPKTPIGRIGGNDKSKKVSPRKPPRSSASAASSSAAKPPRSRDSDRPSPSGSSVRDDATPRGALPARDVQANVDADGVEPVASGAASVRSIVAIPEELAEVDGDDAGEGASRSRPSTAIRRDPRGREMMMMMTDEE